MGDCCSAVAGKDQYQSAFDSVFDAANAQIEFGAAQGGDANAITLGGDLDGALRLASSSASTHAAIRRQTCVGEGLRRWDGRPAFPPGLAC